MEPTNTKRQTADTRDARTLATVGLALHGLSAMVLWSLRVADWLNATPSAENPGIPLGKVSAGLFAIIVNAVACWPLVLGFVIGRYRSRSSLLWLILTSAMSIAVSPVGFVSSCFFFGWIVANRREFSGVTSS